MKKIVVLGSGCSNCKKTFDLIKSQVEAMNLDAEVIKNEDIMALLTYGVMSTPAVIIDEKIVHSGSIPTIDEIKSWF